MAGRRVWKWLGGAVLVVLLATFGLLSYLAGGPRDVYGLLRYGLPNLHRGGLKVGDRAPDVELVSLDGVTRFHLRDRLGGRPLVLIFGSYT